LKEQKDGDKEKHLADHEKPGRLEGLFRRHHRRFKHKKMMKDFGL
jgi:hypothetical protein